MGVAAMQRPLRRRIGVGLALALAFCGAPSPSFAQDEEAIAAGRQLYQEYCATCHGPQGRGDGQLKELLLLPPADLTQLSKRNGGEYPFRRIYQMIDGRWVIKGHGAKDMPVWGPQFRTDIRSSPEADAIARGRILEVMFFLQSIQER
jgi:mono/diheme cytochrome c family protein